MGLGKGPTWRRGARITAAKLAAMVTRGVGTVSGAGTLRRTPAGLSVSPPVVLPYRPLVLSTVGAATEISTGRWSYAMTEAKLTGTTFADKTSPRTFDAINGMEAGNSGSGLQGNGVNLDDDLFTDNPDLELRPIAEGAVVLCYVVPTAAGKSYVFFAPNGMQGDCA